MAVHSALVGLLLLATTATASPRVERPVHRVPGSIDAKGAVDVTSDLQRFVDGVPDGSTIAFPGNARYRLDGTLTFAGRRDLTVEGNGATLFATTDGDRNRSHVRFDGGTDLLVRRLIVVGANPVAGVTTPAYRVDREAQHGFELLGASRVELDGVVVTDVYGDTVYVGRGSDGSLSSQVWVHESRLARTGRQGISVTAGRDVVIERNEITQTRRSTVDLEPNTPSGGAANIYISDNRVGPGRLLFVAAHGGGPVNDVVITGNKLVGRSLTMSVRPPEGDRRSGFYVTGNTSDTAADRTPMRFERVDGVVVRDNHQPVTRARALQGEVGVQVTNVCGVVVAGNDFGDGTAALARNGPDCTARSSLDVPEPPAIPARDRAAQPGSASSSTEPEVASPIQDGGSARDEDTGSIWPYVIPVVALVVGLGALLAVRRGRRRPDAGHIAP